MSAGTLLDAIRNPSTDDGRTDNVGRKTVGVPRYEFLHVGFEGFRSGNFLAPIEWGIVWRAARAHRSSRGSDEKGA